MILPEIADGEDKSSPFKNRIRKNYQHIRKWAKRTQTNCFRIYDRDIKEYPLAIDYYDGRFCVHFFSYDGDELSEGLQEEVLKVLSALFKAVSKQVYWRTRAKREKIEQHEKMGDREQFFQVLEYGVKFLVNLTDYLDTGLFLDHRETRQKVASLAKGKSLLNLFAYTCSFSVQAAHAGARYTKSVDLSNTYIEWGRDNFIVNGLSLKNHDIVRADCLKFLEHETRHYDVIVIDPPTISRSKKMDEMFDIQQDYVKVLKEALALLAPKGSLFFSTNSRKFKFDPSHFVGYQVQDITEKTIPLDFHQGKIHQCYLLKESPATFSTFSKVTEND